MHYKLYSNFLNREDFYPFGLSFNKYQREGSVPNTLKLFQDQEHIDDLGLDWDQFKWRNHQPEIGRFFNIDPLADKYVYNSPYAFSENQVVAHRELEGLEKFDIKYSDGSTGAEYGPYANQQAAETAHDNKMLTSPTENPQITSEVDPNRCHPVYNTERPHNGVDIVNSDNSKTDGAKVVAPVNGTVTKGFQKEGAGNFLSIKGTDGKTHNLFHLQSGSTDKIANGSQVARGQQIGKIGNTGIGTAPHLHYEVRGLNGKVLLPRQQNPGLTNGQANKNVVFTKAPLQIKLQGQISIR
ncbi:MAG: hypothetical protein OJF59_003261 [Cytophagales bacterium]|nr:MAG: hypothetical protein OJF59_003261 [Cytophagales bacterium]